MDKIYATLAIVIILAAILACATFRTPEDPAPTPETTVILPANLVSATPSATPMPLRSLFGG